MKILLCYYLPFIIVTAKVIIIFKIKHKRKKKSKINKCINEMIAILCFRSYIRKHLEVVLLGTLK